MPYRSSLKGAPSTGESRVAVWRRRALAAASGLLLACAAHAAWTPNETQVSSQADLLDPEFSQALGMVVWIDETGHVWVAQVDRDTGAFIPADGKGVLVDPDAQTYGDAQKTYNGAEWVKTSDGDQIVYTKFVGYHTGSNARVGWARQAPDGTWIAQYLDANAIRMAPYGSATPGDPAPRISTFDNRGNHFWRELWNPATEQAIPDFPASSQPVRHVVGARKVTYTLTVNGVDQAFVRDFDTGTVEQLTSDAGMKREVWMWAAPEFGGELIFMSIVNDTQLRVYRKLDVGGGVLQWTPIYSQTPSAGMAIYSPEPFTYNGKSYLFMAMQIAPYDFRSEIWIANIDSSAPIFRRVSDNTVLQSRTEPEVFITNRGPMIYYNSFQPKDRRTPKPCIKVNCSLGVFRADTGLGPQ